jgi:aquaporin Z
MAWSSTQKYLAEFLGTFALLLFGGGAAVFTLGATEGIARAILVSLAIGVAILGAAYALGDISGGHFNPAVTVSMAVAGRMPLKDVIPYIIAQVVGAIVGIGVVLGVVDGFEGSGNFINTVHAGALGSQCYFGNGSPCGFSPGAVFLLEVALTFGFVLVIHLVTRAENGAKNLAPVAIGLTLMITNLTAIPVDGASINPARSFAPALLSAGWSNATWAIDQSWLFWVAPIVGGVLAALVAMALKPKPESA